MLRIAGLLAQSAISQMARLDVISNNVANANTVGYKADKPLFRDFSTVFSAVLTEGGLEARRVSYGVRPDRVATMVGQGPLRQTDGRFDLAISGNGFFVVATPKGQLYTRAGNFRLDSEGFLVTQEGNRVLGSNGPIQVKGTDFRVNSLGEVIVDGEMVDRLQIKDFPRPYRLRKEGANYFSSEYQGFDAANYQVNQGYLEDSTVNPVKEMVNMIEAHRAYEASANAIKVVDELLGNVLREVPRL